MASCTCRKGVLGKVAIEIRLRIYRPSHMVKSILGSQNLVLSDYAISGLCEAEAKIIVEAQSCQKVAYTCECINLATYTCTYSRD
jgi:hypothetical protein